MSEGTQRRLAAIVSADVVGYSRLMGVDETGTLAALKAHRSELIDPLVAKHGGRIVKTMGDGLLLEFPSVVAAVECSVAVQLGMVERNASTSDDTAVRFRVGVHLGDIIVEGTDIFGDGVNVTARLEALSEANGLALSDDAYRQVRDRMDIDWQDGGEHEVKNIARPVHVWRWSVQETRQTSNVVATSETLALPDKPSIAVLPFDNMSGDPEQEYFADGITEDIITELSRFNGLFVIARNTSMTFKGQKLDLRGVSKQLGVRYVMEGSVRKLGERVRITAQLIDGFDGDHVWAERYDGSLKDLFELQEEVTRKVVTSIGTEITQAELGRVGQGTRVFDEANDLAWQSRKLFEESIYRGEASLMDEAIELAERAVSENANCLSAYLGLCRYCHIRQLYGWADDLAGNREIAEAAAREMMARAPRDYSTYEACGRVGLMSGRIAEGTGYLEQAHERNPNDAEVLTTLAWAEAANGNVEKAKNCAHLALRLSPKDRWIGVAHLALAMSAFVERDFEATRHWAELAIQSHPTAPIRRALMIACGAEAGDEALVRAHADYLNNFAPDFIHSLFRRENPIFQQPDHMQMLLDGLSKAGLAD